MKIVALETTEKVGGVAALEGDDLLAEVQFNSQQRSAQSLVPAIQDVLSAVHWLPEEVELVSVAIGPGSFTGLRVGVAATKTFAYVAHSKVIGVGTLRVIAAQAPDEIPLLWTLMNAGRRQLFVGKFVRDESGNLTQVGKTEIQDNDDWLVGLEPGDAVTGPGLDPLAEQLPNGVCALDRALWHPRAATVGRVGYRQYNAGQRDDLWKLVPFYGRPSAAEEKSARRDNS